MGEIIQFRGRTNSMQDTVPFAYTDSKVTVEFLRTDHIAETVEDVKTFILYGRDRGTNDELFVTKCDTDMLMDSIKCTLNALKQTSLTSLERQHLQDRLKECHWLIEELAIELGEWL